MSRIHINLDAQHLDLYDYDEVLIERFPISTALNGPGELRGSNCTPRGAHVIRAKIGTGQPEGTVFVGRRPTGEIFSSELASKYGKRDWILTRILWLSGCEVGLNRLGNVDTMRRYIYIHGTPDSVELGKPGSHGCIRMRNRDIIRLFDQVPVKTSVFIE